MSATQDRERDLGNVDIALLSAVRNIEAVASTATRLDAALGELVWGAVASLNDAREILADLPSVARSSSTPHEEKP